jgi:hypothetical protein
MNKFTLRIPTADQYAFVEIGIEGEDLSIVKQVYDEATAMFKGSDGLEAKEFNAIIDELLTTNKISGDPGVMSEMNLDQNSIIQAIKRSRARTNK